VDNNRIVDSPDMWQIIFDNNKFGKSASLLKYSPDQPRDDHGRFGEGNGDYNLTGSQSDSLTFYTQNGYEEINTYLRDREGFANAMGQEDKNFIQSHTVAIDNAFKDAPPTTAPMTVYRGVFAGQFADTLKTLQPGDTFTDKGFVSTSQNLVTAVDRSTSSWGDGAKLTIEVPTGSRVLDVNKALGDEVQFPKEEEILLNRNSTFEVTKVDGFTINVRLTK
jgi:ADP-ribosyltransferase exoenzyme